MVGQHDIHPAGAADLPAQPPDAQAHLPLGVLVGAAAVERAAAQTEDAQTVDDDEPVVDTVAALGRR